MIFDALTITAFAVTFAIVGILVWVCRKGCSDLNG